MLQRKETGGGSTRSSRRDPCQSSSWCTHRSACTPQQQQHKAICSKICTNSPASCWWLARDQPTSSSRASSARRWSPPLPSPSRTAPAAAAAAAANSAAANAAATIPAAEAAASEDRATPYYRIRGSAVPIEQNAHALLQQGTSLPKDSSRTRNSSSRSTCSTTSNSSSSSSSS